MLSEVVLVNLMDEFSSVLISIFLVKRPTVFVQAIWPCVLEGVPYHERAMGDVTPDRSRGHGRDQCISGL